MTNINLRHPRNPRLKFIHDTPSFLLDIVPQLMQSVPPFILLFPSFPLISPQRVSKN